VTEGLASGFAARMTEKSPVAPKHPFEQLLKVFWRIKLGDAEDQRLQLFEPQASFVIA
jgi:hypothetical protein